MFQLRPAASRLAWLTLAAGIVSLPGCQANKPPPPSARTYAADFVGGAKTCTVPRPALKDGELAPVDMTVGNDGGWCGITVVRDGKPYDAGLLTARPEHGRVFVHSVGDTTRIDYTPDRGFAGTDSFTVKLLPGNTGVRASVMVSGSQEPATPAERKERS